MVQASDGLVIAAVLTSPSPLPAGVLKVSEQEDSFIREGAVGRLFKVGLRTYPTARHPSPIPPPARPKTLTPPAPAASLSLICTAFACAAGEEKCLAYMIKKASRDVTFTSQDPTVDILFKPR